MTEQGDLSSSLCKPERAWMQCGVGLAALDAVVVGRSATACLAWRGLLHGVEVVSSVRAASAGVRLGAFVYGLRSGRL